MQRSPLSLPLGTIDNLQLSFCRARSRCRVPSRSGRWGLLRICILGFSCSGKSTFSSWLGSQTGLPVFHLDQYFWKYPWVRNESFDLTQIICQKDWIIDGTYHQYNFQERLDHCDLIVYLDCGICTRIFRMIRRHIRYLQDSEGKNAISQKVNVKFLFITCQKVFFVQPRLLHMLREQYKSKLIYIKGFRGTQTFMERIVHEDFLKLFNSSQTRPGNHIE